MGALGFYHAQNSHQHLTPSTSPHLQITLSYMASIINHIWVDAVVLGSDLIQKGHISILWRLSTPPLETYCKPIVVVEGNEFNVSHASALELRRTFQKKKAYFASKADLLVILNSSPSTTHCPRIQYGSSGGFERIYSSCALIANTSLSINLVGTNSTTPPSPFGQIPL